MKKRIIISVVFLITVLSLCGCGTKKEAGEKPENSSEPTLSDEAETHYQFIYPKEGDLCADIYILNYGHVYIRLFDEEVPYACDNFITKAENGEYDGTKISDAVVGYYVQAGKLLDTEKKAESIWGGGFSNEISDKLFPVRGSVCMANQGEDGTNAMEFFFVTTQSDVVQGLEEPLRERYGMSLNEYLKSVYHTDLTEEQLNMFNEYGGAPWIYGHNTVFAQVFDGFDVLDEIEKGLNENSRENIYIKKITIYEHT